MTLEISPYTQNPTARGCGVERKVLPMEQPIKYFSFWDVPRTFAFEQAGMVYVLTSEFDDDLDEYPDDYEVFIVSGIANLSVVSDWKIIEPMPKTRVGKVPVAAVQFDESRRKFVESSFLDRIQQGGIKLAGETSRLHSECL